MSADLLAEFGSNSRLTQNKVPLKQHQQLSNSNSPDLSNPEHATPAHESNHILVDASSPGSSGMIQNLWHREEETRSEVLFDVATQPYHANDDNEDWGEFESPQTGTNRNRPSEVAVFEGPSLIHLSAVEDNTQSGPTKATNPMQYLTTNEIGLWADTRGVGQATRGKDAAESLEHSAQKGTAPFSKESIDDWTSFVDPVNENQDQIGQRAVDGTLPKNVHRGIYAQPHAEKSRNKIPGSQIRPVNIPPPSVLLQLFTQILNKFHEEAARTKGDTGGSRYPADLALRLAYTLKAAARVLAGRTLRWKRDSILGQSLKMGPARSGKAGGMKLRPITRSEGLKEEQEAVGVTEAWRQHATLFNSVMVLSGGRPFPVVPDKTKVATANSDQGALMAPHVCALCGLKRDERLPRVDENVEDSFGEWWIDHWGHTDCKRFWEESSWYLHQR
jgi:hypothetical protein